MGMGVGEQVRKIELDAYQAFMKVTAVTGMSWVRPATPDPPPARSRATRILFPMSSFRAHLSSPSPRSSPALP